YPAQSARQARLQPTGRRAQLGPNSRRWKFPTATARPGTFEFENKDRNGFTANDRLGARICRVEERVCQRFSRRTPGRAPIKMKSLTLIIVGVPSSKPTMISVND